MWRNYKYIFGGLTFVQMQWQKIKLSIELKCWDNFCAWHCPCLLIFPLKGKEIKLLCLSVCLIAWFVFFPQVTNSMFNDRSHLSQLPGKKPGLGKSGVFVCFWCFALGLAWVCFGGCLEFYANESKLNYMHQI